MKYAKLVQHLVIRRHALGLTQKDVAQLMGVGAPQHLGRLEGMQRIATTPTLEAWCEALGLSLHFDVKVVERVGKRIHGRHPRNRANRRDDKGTVG